MTVFYIMLIIFIVGYGFIMFEHVNHINKAATALLTGALLWTVYALGAENILSLGYSSSWTAFSSELSGDKGHSIHEFITEHELLRHLSDISAIVLFLLGAMTIVEVVDRYHAFRLITDKIRTKKKVALLWMVSFLTFFMSAILDNLTTTIVMVALLGKLIQKQEDRWYFAGMVIIAANSGGAFSPIGDVTTIMLWIGGQITAATIIKTIFLPSLICMLVPLIALSLSMKGNLDEMKIEANGDNVTTNKQKRFVLTIGVLALISVPVFKTYTHLPPYMGILFGLSIFWIITDLRIKISENDNLGKLSVGNILGKVDVPTVLFFLGILSAVASLQSAGHLDVLAQWLDDNVRNIFAINIIIGLLSAVVDNVPLVAASMGMYPIAEPGSTGYLVDFVINGHFWSFLAYCAGTGGSVLIIGSAAGVAAMGLEKINFIWYMKKIGWLALLGYFSGAAFYIIEAHMGL